MKHNTHGFEIEENEHDVVDKDYPEIKARVEQTEWVVKLKNQAGEEWKTKCTDHYAWKAAEYIMELEKQLMVFRTGADLFEVGDFTSHAGLPLAWKIECDAIRPEWWDGLARMIMDYQTEPFSKVVGIPRGGMALAYAMEKYVTPGDHPWMVVDDVYTTGTSFREFCTDNQTMFAYKWCAFARKPIEGDTSHDVRALFTMPQST
jgi:hypothetical protein|tara:strand:+ start:1885 stop:2496 length:612 start_codon:yes stop_codon:yes gene_type:complete